MFLLEQTENEYGRKVKVCFLLCIGGTLKMEDLKSFQVQVDDAWTVPLGNTQMHIPPPPSGGALLALILRVMKGSFTEQTYCSN